jgi:hypothetical protein
LGGLLFAFAAVLSAQALSQYVAQKVIEIVAIMNSNVEDKSARIAESTGLTAAMYLYGRLKDAQRSRRMQAAFSSAANMPSSGVGGTLPIPVTNPETQDSQESRQNEDKSPDSDAVKPAAKMSKIDTAIGLLKSDRTLRKLSTRDLEDKYPEIKRNTWATAKQRLGM